MSGPTIRINDGAFPDVGIADAGGSAIEISDINDFDLGLLGNQRKLGSSTPPPASSGPVMTLSGGGGLDDVEVVDLDSGGVSFDVKPISGPAPSDTIRILRDSAPSVPVRPIDSTLNLSGLVSPAPAVS